MSADDGRSGQIVFGVFASLPHWEGRCFANPPYAIQGNFDFIHPDDHQAIIIVHCHYYYYLS